MALTTGARIVSSHAWFFREGDAFTVPSPGTCGRESKPGADDTAWVDVGIITDLKVAPQREVHERWIPAPGQKRLYDVLESKKQIKITFTTDEMSPLAIEHLFQTDKLGESSTQYNPLEGTTKRGWLKVQQYDHTDTLVNVIDVYVHLVIEQETDFADGPVTFTFTANVLHSSLNTGTL